MTQAQIQQSQLGYKFLVNLRNALNEHLPSPDLMRANVSALWDKPKATKSPQEALACKENIFFYHFALPEIFKQAAALDGLSPEKARTSIRCEYFAKFPHLSSGNARRVQGYPFPKKLGIKTKEVMDAWKKPKGTYALFEAYPDMSLTAPFPFNIVSRTKT